MKGVGHNDDELYDKNKNKQSGYCVRFLLTHCILYAFSPESLCFPEFFCFRQETKMIARPSQLTTIAQSPNDKTSR